MVNDKAMKSDRPRWVEPFIEVLHRLPFVEGVTVRAELVSLGWECCLVTVLTPDGAEELQVVLPDHRVHGDTEALRRLHRSLGDSKHPVLLALPLVSPQSAADLREAGIQYLDRAGNCYLAFGQRYLAWVEGRTPEAALPRGREMRGAGYRVLFALLVSPTLAGAPLRTLADAAGVSRTAASVLLGRLREEGHLYRRQGAPVLRQSRELVDRWLVGYRDLVRPRLRLGRFALPHGQKDALVRTLGVALGDRWAWGGVEADRALGGLYQAPDLTVHVRAWERPDPAHIPLRADPEGLVEVLGIPGPSAWVEAEQARVHPLLVYSELRISRDPRAWEAAEALIQRLHLAGDEH